MNSVTFDARSLRGAFKIVDPMIERKSTIPALGCVRLAVQDGVASIRAGSTSGYAQSSVAIVDADTGPFDILIPADRLAPALNVAEEEFEVTIQKNARAAIQTGQYRFQVSTHPGKDLPELRVSENLIAEVDCGAIGKMASQVAFACDPKDIRPFAQGVWFESDGEKISVVATNDRMMATTHAAFKGQPFGFMLPQRSAMQLVDFDPERIEVTASYVVARRGVASITLMPSTSRYVAWQRAIPDPKCSVAFYTRQLLDALALHRAYDSDRGAVHFALEGETCSLKSKADDREVDASIDVHSTVNADDFSFSFDGSQLMRVLAHAPDDVVTIYWDSSKPASFLLQNGNWRGVVSRLKI